MAEPTPTPQTVRDFTRDAETAANSMAESVADFTEEAGQNVKRVARRTVEGVQRSAEYFRNHGAQQIADDLREYAKANPTHAIVGAAVLGFFLGRLVSRN